MSTSLTARSLVTGAAAALVVVVLAGCGDGRRDTEIFNPEPVTTEQPAPPVVAPSAAAPAAAPVVSAAPATKPANASRAADTGGTSGDLASRRAAHRRAASAWALRKARRRAARKARAEHARNARLEAKLRAARKRAARAKAERQEALDLAESHTKGDKSQITGSDVSEISQADRDRRSNAEARAAIVRFHELLDHHDGAACDLLTPRLRHEFYGDKDPDAMQRCRAGARAITERVSVQILSSGAHGRKALADTVTYLGDQSIHQALALVLVDGTWLIDRVKRADT